MASVTVEQNGNRRISFMGCDRKRRHIRLGTVSAKDASYFANRIETILEAAALGKPLDLATASWLSSLPDTMKTKLANAGLIAQSEIGTNLDSLLGRFLAGYMARRTDLKESTKTFLTHTIRNLNRFFGESRSLSSITPSECDDFKRWLMNDEKLANATVCRRCSLASTFFRDAKRRRLITENPWEDVKRSAKTNPARQQYISTATIDAILKSCPNSDWRLLVALSRYAGLRVPSEPLLLKWEDIDWEQGRMKVTSPKTEHHQGKASRMVPIVPEVAGLLREAFETAEDGSVYVLERFRERASVEEHTNWRKVNLRTTFFKIIKRAGVPVWPRMWHNLRSSCQTDLTDRFPSHVVCSWLGNSEAVARDHYLKVLDRHFEAAVEGGEKAHQNAHHGMPKGGKIGPIRESKNEKTPCFQHIEARGWAIQDSNL